MSATQEETAMTTDSARSDKIKTPFAKVIVEKIQERPSYIPTSQDIVEQIHSRWITVVETNGKEYSKCADCQMELDGLEDAYSFCPYCGAKMDDKDINVPTKSGMEEEYDG